MKPPANIKMTKCRSGFLLSYCYFLCKVEVVSIKVLFALFTQGSAITVYYLEEVI